MTEVNPFSEKMKQAWSCFEKDKIQQTCQLLLEILNECDEKQLPLPDDHDKLIKLCMFKDAAKIFAEKFKEKLQPQEKS